VFDRQDIEFKVMADWQRSRMASMRNGTEQLLRFDFYGNWRRCQSK
jgi:hypothetical protein